MDRRTTSGTSPYLTDKKIDSTKQNQIQQAQNWDLYN